MYKSPIEIIDDFNNGVAKAVMDETENQVYKAVYNVGVNVDKGELLKALAYDRDQYDKGYVDGKADAIVHAHWVVDFRGSYGVRYCSNCGGRGNDTHTHYGRTHGDVDGFRIKPLPYCPHCGAKMDEEVSE